MNTPTHLVVNLAALAKKEKPEFNPYIIAGSFLPDTMAFVLFVWEGIIKQTPQRIIWDEIYFSPSWQTAINYLNSIPVLIGIILLSYWKKILPLYYLSFSMLIHVLLDFPLHNDDAYAHFLPFSDWRFVSPISYWDPNHYGNIFGIIELFIFGMAAYIAYRKLNNKYAKRTLLIFGGVWSILSIVVTIMFLFNPNFGPQ